MASVVVQAYIGGLRAEPPVGLKPEPLARGENPPEAEKLFLDVQWKPQMCPFFKIWKHNEIRYLCSSLQRNQGWLQNWGACAPPLRFGPKIATGCNHPCYATETFFSTAKPEWIIGL